jgi:hypothetical protein
VRDLIFFAAVTINIASSRDLMLLFQKKLFPILGAEELFYKTKYLNPKRAKVERELPSFYFYHLNI